MVFSSTIFLFLFLPIIILGNFLLNQKYRNTFLFIGSLLFYFWGEKTLTIIMLSSILINYISGIGISYLQKKERPVKPLLTLAIIANLSFLFYYKYFDFFIDNISYFGFKSSFQDSEIILPIGISFFTFQGISYLIDLYRKEVDYQKNIIHLGLYISFFPQLIAGPIVKYNHMMSQFDDPNNRLINRQNLNLGLVIILIGLFKKIILADNLAIFVEDGFSDNQNIEFFASWLTSLSFTFQIYFDFSGYTDMALGIALLFNIKLPINFNSPYKATNIQDFWRRWHITLSRFLRDYIYIPLGGSRQSSLKTYSNLILTFIIGGLWHGAGWTFLFWGFLHGIGLVVHRIWSVVGFKLNSIISWIITFNFINFTFVFFRAEEWNDATTILNKMLKFGVIEEINLTEVLLIASSFLLVLLFKNSNQLKKSFSIYTGIYIGILFFLSFVLLFLRGEGEFLYFQF